MLRSRLSSEPQLPMFNKIGKAKKFIEFLFGRKNLKNVEIRDILKSGQPDFKKKEKLKCE